jgi:para-nitrobenzyl esterase
VLLVLIAILNAAMLACSPKAPDSAGAPPAESVSLDNTAWRLVMFEGGDGTRLTPDDPSKYTIEFDASGHVAARFDCNRGRGSWKASGPSLELGPMALTRAMCPPGSLHDHLVKQWPYIRSYLIKDGHLYLSLMADGGIYEFEPAGARSGAP